MKYVQDNAEEAVRRVKAIALVHETLSQTLDGPIDFDERKWSPEKAKLKVYEGPALRALGVALITGPNSLAMQVLVSAGGLAAMTAVAYYVSWSKRQDHKSALGAHA